MGDNVKRNKFNIKYNQTNVVVLTLQDTTKDEVMKHFEAASEYEQVDSFVHLWYEDLNILFEDFGYAQVSSKNMFMVKTVRQV